MKLKSFKINYSHVSFFILFPGFFIYNFLIAKNYIPPFLGGYFGVIGGGLFLLYIPFFLIDFNFNRLSNLEILFLMYEILLILMYVYHFLLMHPFVLTKEVFLQNIMDCLYNLLLYFVAKNLVITKRFITLCIVFFIIMSIILFVNYSFEYKILILQRTAEYGQEFISSYQGMGRSLLVVAFIILTFYFHDKRLIFIFIFICLILYLNGSRTEFVFSIISYALIYFFTGSFNKKIALIFFFVLLVVSLFVFYDYIPNNRVLNLLNLSNDGSAILRIEQIYFSLDRISISPMFGDYAAHVYFGNSLGDYAHTALISSWLDLGIFGFIFLCSIIFMIVYLVFIGLMNKKISNPHFLLFAIVALYFIMSFIVTKNYGFMFLGFTVGLYANYHNNKLLIKEEINKADSIMSI